MKTDIVFFYKKRCSNIDQEVERLIFEKSKTTSVARSKFLLSKIQMLESEKSYYKEFIDCLTIV